MLATQRTKVELVSTLLVEVRHKRSLEHECAINSDAILVHYDCAVRNVLHLVDTFGSTAIAFIAILYEKLMNISNCRTPGSKVLSVEEVECASAFLIPVCDIRTVGRDSEDLLVGAGKTVCQIYIRYNLLGSPVDCDCFRCDGTAVRLSAVGNNFLACGRSKRCQRHHQQCDKR
jgi:hypothetical protein